MRSVSNVFLFSILLLFGCGSMHLIQHDESSYTETEEKIQEKEASITLASGQIVEGRNISITLDSTSWIGSKSHERQIVPTSEVKEIAVLKSAGSAIQGLMLGLLGGTGAGLLISELTYQCDEKVSDCDMKPLYQWGSALLGGVIGGLCGLSIGSGRKSSDTYVFNAPRDTTYINNAERNGQKAAESWLALLDSTKYSEAWNEAARIVRQRLRQQPWEMDLRSLRASYGLSESRELKSAEYAWLLTDETIQEQVIIEFDSVFEKRKAVIETLTVLIDEDGRWRVSRYYTKRP